MSVQVADLVANLSGRDQGFTAMMGLADTRIGALGKSTERSILSVRGLGLAMGALGIGGIVETTKAAADFQVQLIALSHGAGELASNLPMVSTGILQMAGQVGVSAQDLVKAMYNIDSAGFHGAASLLVLKASAEGAKTGMASQAVVADALTTVLNDYHLSAGAAAGVTGQMIATVAAGKMHFQDLSASLSKVIPIAASLNIPFQQVSAALATMTAHGVPASRAATAIQAGLMQLIAPSAKAQAAIRGLGIPLDQLQQKLASGDLYGAMNMFSQAMETKLPASARNAIGNAQKEFAKGMDPAKIFPQLEAQLGPQYATLIKNLVQSFGGVRGGAMALNLIPNMSTFKADIASIGTPVQGLGKLMQSWGLVNTALAQQLDKLSASLGAMAIQVGQVFVPIITRMLNNLQPIFSVFMSFVSANPKTVAAFLAISAAIGIATAATFAFGPALALITSPVGALIAVGAALYEAWTHDFGGIQELTRSVYSYIQPALQQIAVAVRDVVDVFKLGGISAAAPVALANAEALLGQLGNWITGTGLPYLQSHLRGWVDAYWQWIQGVYGPLISAAGNLLGQFGNWITGTAAPAIGAKLHAWGTAFSAWIGPAATTFLQHWPAILNRFLDWITAAAAPILGKLAIWGGQFIRWIVPMIPGMIKTMALIAAGIFVFINETALTLGIRLLKWTGAFIGWIAPMIPGAVKALGKLAEELLGWVAREAYILPGQFTNLGGQIIAGLIKGIQNHAGDLKGAMESLAKNAVETPFKAFLGIFSPSTVFAQHGVNLVQGLINGIQSQHGALGQAMATLSRVVNPSTGTLSLSAPLGGRGVFSGSGPVTVTVNSGAITVTNGQGQHDTTSARNIGEALGEFVSQMVNAQRTSASTAPSHLPGNVRTR